MTSKKKQILIVLKKAESDSLYRCNIEELSRYFVRRQINDYCVSTEGITLKK